MVRVYVTSLQQMVSPAEGDFGSNRPETTDLSKDVIRSRGVNLPSGGEN